MPQCDLYDGTGDPGEHVYQFQTNMLLLQVSDAVMCRAFPTTLRKAAHAWFKSLQPRSIYSFGQLSDLFQKYFVSSRSRKKNSASLLNIVQEKNESLACFLGRFNAATLEIDNLDESVKYTAFLRGLQPTSKFAFSVNKSPPGRARKAYAREVYITSQPPDKKSKTVPVAAVTFSDEDSKDIQTPHDDPLVITVRAGNFDVKRVLIDNESSAEILFFDAFKKMNIPTDRLRKMDTPLYGFSNHPVAAEGLLSIQRHIRTTSTQSITSCSVNLSPQDEIPHGTRDWRGERGPDYSSSMLRNFVPTKEGKEIGLRGNLDLIEEVRTQAHERSVVIKQRVAQ
ncbi:hypothetical protein RJ639_000084 [Escallonia herrerae]|uniref:Retrotransposon gag domain-containing protein n=1 Tax=Escallonia herrerae TaxID=1293975 RepID=A0AA88XBT2_9ASTE|nr:hypothetical protein RJ639_000084 [Escallonia herrerae]